MCTRGKWPNRFSQVSAHNSLEISLHFKIQGMFVITGQPWEKSGLNGPVLPVATWMAQRITATFFLEIKQTWALMKMARPSIASWRKIKAYWCVIQKVVLKQTPPGFTQKKSAVQAKHSPVTMISLSPGPQQRSPPLPCSAFVPVTWGLALSTHIPRPLSPKLKSHKQLISMLILKSVCLIWTLSQR